VTVVPILIRDVATAIAARQIHGSYVGWDASP
jgi:hypothetical protein